MTKNTLKPIFFIAVVFSFLNFGLSLSVFAQNDFNLVPLGIHGGGNEGNLSVYLIADAESDNFIALDAGNIRNGIEKAIENKIFEGKSEEIIQNRIKGYFISHGHLDHLAGLIINSPDDKGPKPIYGLPFTLDILKNNYFTNDAWSNFANEGDKPEIGTYFYKPIKDTEKFKFINTALKGQIFELSHVNPYKSSAVLVTNSKGNSVLYFGDTGADRIEKSDKLNKVWKAVAPLVKTGQLKAMLIENSYDNSRDEDLLFGHLTPKLLNEELQILADKAGLSDLSKLKIIITHLKPGGDQIKRIKADWKTENPLKVQIVFPKQGEKLSL